MAGSTKENGQLIGSNISRRDFLRIVGRSTAAAFLAAGVGGAAASAGQRQPIYDPSLQQLDTQAELAVALGPKIGKGVHVPDSYQDIEIRALTRGVKIDGVKIPKLSEGIWVRLVYNPKLAGKKDNWEGIGPAYPAAVTNLDSNASALSSDGTTGRLIISAREGGRVQLSFMQLDNFQDDGAWSNGVQNPAWEMQYRFNGFIPGQPIMAVDADTGKRLRRQDGSLAQYIADSEGKIAFEIPETHGNDVRVGFVFDVQPKIPGQTAQQIIIDRGPIDHPELGLANSLPRKGIIKPMLPGQRR
ncbi:MAG: hypothetical protein HY426_01770 [Candidatus Levybacteria bacterium]|nr:hypothetical protein [Candidatus Levybacteria bacterium]